MGRDAKAFGDLRRGVATQDETGDVLLALGQLVGGHEQRRDSRVDQPSLVIRAFSSSSKTSKGSAVKAAP